MPQRNTGQARHLRQRQTRAEQVLWRALRNRKAGGLKFRRQYPIERFIVDFCCLERRLVVEVDGDSHVNPERDAARDARLIKLGYRVVRVTNADVLENVEGTVDWLLQQIFGAENEKRL